MRWLACLLIMSSLAYAEKPTLAVLGVVAKDQFSAKAADTLTLALRTQASAKSSGYAVKGSPKQIKTAIMAAECSIDSASCASKLASELGADYALAGDVERRGNRSIVVLALVDVKKKQRIRSVRETGADMKKLARSAYTRLVDAEAGELHLAANAQRGEIYIDGQL